MSVASDFGCFIVIGSWDWKNHGSPYLAVPVVSKLISGPLDVSALLGEQGALYSWTVRWPDGVGIEFHTLESSQGQFNDATLDVMEQLKIEPNIEQDEESTTILPCTIVTCPGKMPLSKFVYDWFCRACQRNLY